MTESDSTAHQHGHPHEHPHADARGHVSSHNPHAGQGPVILDLGDGIGALVLRTPEHLVGHEIDISPVGHDDQRHHVEVLPRQTGQHMIYAAVYPGLAEGSWTLWRTSGQPALVVDVTGGRVTEVEWPA